MQLETPDNTNRDNSTDPTSSCLLIKATLTPSCFPSSSLIRTRHSLSRASHVHTNTFAGYHTATLFLLNRRSLFSDLEHKGSGQRLRKNQARPPRLLSTTKIKNAQLKKWSSLEEHQFSDQAQFTVLVFQIRSRSKANRQPVLHLLQAG